MPRDNDEGDHHSLEIVGPFSDYEQALVFQREWERQGDGSLDWFGGYPAAFTIAPDDLVTDARNPADLRAQWAEWAEA